MRWTGFASGRAGRSCSRLRRSFPKRSSEVRSCCIGLAEAYLQQGDKRRRMRRRGSAGGRHEGPTNHLELAANLQHDGLFAGRKGNSAIVAREMDSDPLEALAGKAVSVGNAA